MVIELKGLLIDSVWMRLLLLTRLAYWVACGYFGTLVRWRWLNYLQLNKRFMQQYPPQAPLWLLSAIYDSPRFAERCLIWENLNSVAELHAMPWVIVGDFNEVLMGDDKFGGRPVNLGKALRFQECLDNCNMIDIGFFGPRYTWFICRPLSRLGLFVGHCLDLSKRE